jgi:hypothetical protein
VIGETWTPRQRLRAVRGGAALGAVVLHVVFLVAMRPDPRLPWLPVEDTTHPPFVVTLHRPPRPQAERPTTVRKPEREDRDARLAPPSPADVARLAPASPPASAPTGPPRNPGQPGARPGINWGGNPPDGPARKALRDAVGCTLDIPLTRREQSGCDERMGRDRNRPPRTSPLMADLARQREMARDADYKMRLREWKSEPAPAGSNIFGTELGSQPPAK